MLYKRENQVNFLNYIYNLTDITKNKYNLFKKINYLKFIKHFINNKV